MSNWTENALKAQIRISLNGQDGKPIPPIMTWTGFIDASIHVEDFATVLRTRVFGKNADPELVCEAMFLDSLPKDNNPRGVWSVEQVSEIQSRSVSPEFLRKFSRAMERGRLATFNDSEIFILKAWRSITIDGEQFPGLREWAPKAAISFLDFFNVLKGLSDSAYISTRKRMGLSPGSIGVRDFVVSKTQVEVVFKGGSKKSLLRPRK